VSHSISPTKPLRVRSHLIGIFIGVIGALLALSPWGLKLDEYFGLGLLFHLRGKREAPTEVVVISIDQRSAAALNFPDEPPLWPHRSHADLVRKLADADVAFVAFNIFFDAIQRDEEDEALAAALRQSGNVVLASYLKPRDINPLLYAESVLQPISVLADAALATAPFLLPKQSQVVTQFLTFDRAGDDVVTLPAILLNLFVFREATDELLAVMRSWKPSVADYLQAHPLSYENRHHLDGVMKELAKELKDARSAESLLETARTLQLPPARLSLIEALVTLYSRRNTHYFDHYGPADTIVTIPYHEVLEHFGAYRESLRGKIVLVGFSEDLQPESTEGSFYTVFSAISSVELAATAVANLLENRTLRPVPPLAQLAGLFLWGYLIGWAGQIGTLRHTALTIGALQAGYLSFCYGAFTLCNWWLPWLTPLIFQGGASMLAAWVGRYREHYRERRKMQEVVERFVPVEVVSQLGEQRTCDDIARHGRLSFGVCLATDAGRYAALAESMDPMSLGDLMNEYYSAIFRPIHEQGGWVSDVIGDAMLAIWATPADQIDLRHRALTAALGVRTAAAGFEQSRRVRLPIRIGVHSGEMRVGYVGSPDHGEYRAVGDTVNTAARIEALNKLLGTQALASEPAVEGLDAFFSFRRLGNFQLAGKNRPVTVYELIAADSDRVRVMSARFADALHLFDAGRWHAALTGFVSLLEEFPDDGPSHFYVGLCRDFLSSPTDAPGNHRIIKTTKQEGARRV